MRWIFVWNAVIAVNAVKINISPHFTAFLTKIHRKIHRISYKNSPHRLLWQINVRNAVKAVNEVKKNNSPRFIAFLTKIHHIWFPKITQSDLNSRNCKEVSDSWRSGLNNWRHAGGQRLETVWGRFFFLRILRTRWKLIIHRDSPRSPQKDVRNRRWKSFFFHRISPHFLRNFTAKPRPGSSNIKICGSKVMFPMCQSYNSQRRHFSAS